MWKVLNKEIDFGEPISLIMYTRDAFKDNVEKAKKLWTITEPCLNPEFPQGTTDKLPFSANVSFSSLSYETEGHAKKCVERDDSTTLHSIYSLHR